MYIHLHTIYIYIYTHIIIHIHIYIYIYTSLVYIQMGPGATRGSIDEIYAVSIAREPVCAQRGARLFPEKGG